MCHDPNADFGAGPRARRKMSSNQAYYVQDWVVGAIAIAYLKIRDAGLATPPQTEIIAHWMQCVGEQTKQYYEAHKKAAHGDSRNNHLYWAGVELAAIGVAANDRKDFDWAMATYDNGVDQIQPDGMHGTWDRVRIAVHIRTPETPSGQRMVAGPAVTA